MPTVACEYKTAVLEPGCPKVLEGILQCVREACNGATERQLARVKKVRPLESLHVVAHVFPKHLQDAQHLPRPIGSFIMLVLVPQEHLFEV